jgi:hypothetical protein
MCINCYKECFKDRRGCFHCYTTKYMKKYSDNNYLYCPAVHCTTESCIEYLDEETEQNEALCCHSYNDPCCHNCALIFCPIALVLDLISMPCRTCKHKCCNNKQKVIVSQKIKPDVHIIEIQPN